MQHNKEFLFDLSHYLTSVCIERAQLIIFQKEVVGVDSELIFSVNRTLLELAENQQLERIINYYIKKDE